MKIIGLTGPSGSGKGWICAILKEWGIPSVDTDAVYHSLLCPPSACLDELHAGFGDSIMTADGTLDRRALAKMVFSNDQLLSRLNVITHKYILGETEPVLKKYAAQGYPAVVVDAPALFEAGWETKCSFVIAALADRETRLQRIIKRDGLSFEAAEQRINGQPCDDFYISRAEYTVYNNGDDMSLKVELRKIMSRESILNDSMV